MVKLAFYLPSLRGGGAERMFLHLANALANRGWVIDLLLVEAKGPYLKDISPQVNVIHFKKKRVLYSCPALVRYLVTTKPDVLFTAMNHVNIIALLARIISLNRKTRVIVSIRNTLSKTYDKKGIRGFLQFQLMRMLYNYADKIITVSDGVANDFKEFTGVKTDKVQTIYNPVINDELLRLSKQELNHRWFKPNSPKVVLAAGRLTEQKDFGTLIKAFASVDKTTDTRLLILGEGEERTNLERLVKDLALSEKVQMPGFADNPFKFMKHADVFVLSSRWEGLPGVLIQAMACGAPVVSTDCPSGPREILGNGEYGELVPVEDETKLAQAIIHTLNKNDEPNYEAALERFKEPKVIDQVEELIRNG